jgi:hypothetical protein
MGATNKISDRSGWKTRGSEVLCTFRRQRGEAGQQNDRFTFLYFLLTLAYAEMSDMRETRRVEG